MDRIVKVLAAILFSIFLCSACWMAWSFGFWLYSIWKLPFCQQHPGVILVGVGAVGLFIFGHEKPKTFWKRLAIWCDLILVAGLLLEWRETVNEDSKILALQKQLLPRTIDADTISNFIFLTEKFPKRQIKVFYEEGRGETGNYARQIRNMLNMAGFGQDTNGHLFGTNPTKDKIIRKGMGDTFWPSIEVFAYSDHATGTNMSFFVTTNGFRKPIQVINNTEEVAGNLIDVLKQIGISSEWHGTTNEAGIKPDEIWFHVIEKP